MAPKTDVIAELRSRVAELEAVAAAAVLSNVQLREAAKLNVPTAFYEEGVWFFGTDESASQVDPYKSKLLDALATPISTEALDKYVAEKVKEAMK